MADVEKVIKAKMYIDKLANGIDPVTNKAVPMDSTINNIHVSRCLFYVSGILNQVIENNGNLKARSKRVKKQPFHVTDKKKNEFYYIKVPVSISNIMEIINSTADLNTVKRLPSTAVTNFLIDKGFLYIDVNEDGKKRKLPTEKGSRLGISTEFMQGIYGGYKVVLYDEFAQRYIIDNLDEIINMYYTK